MSVRYSQVISVSLPPTTAKSLEKMAKSEKKSKSEVVDEAIKSYKAKKFESDWEKVRKWGEETRKKFNFKNEEELLTFLNSD